MNKAIAEVKIAKADHVAVECGKWEVDTFKCDDPDSIGITVSLGSGYDAPSVDIFVSVVDGKLRVVADGFPAGGASE